MLEEKSTRQKKDANKAPSLLHYQLFCFHIDSAANYNNNTSENKNKKI
jgi:hypothetical protein